MTDFNGSLSNPVPLLKVGHGWVIKSHRKPWMLLLIHAETSGNLPVKGAHGVCFVCIGDTVTFVIPREKGGYVIGLGRKIVALDWDTPEVTTLAEIEKRGLNNRLNDGKCDPAGRLWTGETAQPVSLRLMTSQFKDIVTHRQKNENSKMQILRCMGSKFCVKFQRRPLKFHTKFVTHTPQNKHFTRC